MASVTMREMLEAGIHFGHRTRFWDPKMAPYIFGARNQIHIINLEKSLPMFRKALDVVQEVASRNGRILFVGTKRSAREVIKEEASRCGMPYIDYRWLGGTLTNYKTIRQSVKRLVQLEEQFEGNKLNGLTKKEILQLEREKEKLSRSLGGIKNMGGLPDLIFVVDVGYEQLAITEARKLGLPIIGVVDTNSNPENIDYVIPGNDDAIRAIRFYTQHVADTIIEARKAFTEDNTSLLEKSPAKKASQGDGQESAKVGKEKSSKSAKAKKPQSKEETAKEKEASPKVAAASSSESNANAESGAQ